MSVGLKVYKAVGPGRNEPFDQMWYLSAQTIPVACSISFDHEPSAEEAEEAWGKLNAAIKKGLLERMKCQQP